MSRPTRARGLKRVSLHTINKRKKVAPHKGAWIETTCFCAFYASTDVAPHKGAWIETLLLHYYARSTMVAPHKGAWIETILIDRNNRIIGRAPQGRVD